MGSVRVMLVGLTHPTALNVLPAHPDFSLMEMAIAPSANWVASNARTGMAFASPANKVSLRMLMIVPSATPSNL